MSPRSAGRTGDGRAAAQAEIVQSFNRLFKTIDTFSRYTLRVFGVSGPQLWALRTVAAAGRITIGDLSDRMHLHISTVSGILDRLERARFLARERSDADRRVVRLRITEKGRGIIARAPEPPRAKLARKILRLKGPEIRSLLRGLRRLVGLVELDRIEAFLQAEETRRQAT